MQSCCDDTYSFAPQMAPKAAWRALTGFAGIFGRVKKKKNPLGFICIFWPRFKRYICAQADTVWSDDWRFGMWGKEGREGARKEGEGQGKVGGVCFYRARDCHPVGGSSCGVLIEIQQMWGERGMKRERKGEREREGERFPPTQ